MNSPQPHAEKPAGSKPSPPQGGGALYGAAVEYGMHCLTWLVARDAPVSSRDLAELQGVPPAMIAKIMPRLEKAGMVASSGGINGGYRLARPPETISMLDVADAIDGRRSLIACREVRRNCALFEDEAPRWATRRVCGIHAIMLRAEKAMRAELARTSLLDVVDNIPAPPEFAPEIDVWLSARARDREQSRISAIRAGTRRRSSDD
jgi:Rrf2 family protein